MGIYMREALVWAFALALAIGGGDAQNSSTLVPAIITFGDSAVDVGNNDYIPTIFKANYPPYGRDFVNHKPTGRFCNGKLATDLTADTLGFTTYPPAYLSPQASGKNLLIGANFASAASGYDDKTAVLNHAIPLSQQLEYYKEYQGKLAQIAGNQNAASILKDGLYILSFGSSDFLQNYYVNPFINKVLTPDQYSSYLVGIFSSFIKVPTKLSLLLLEWMRWKNYLRPNIKRGRMSDDEKDLIIRLHKLLGNRLVAHSFSTLYFFFFHSFFLYFVFCFAEASKGCCGTGTVETTSLLCNPKSIGTCSNASQYVFWDSVHPSEAANQVLADSLILQGINLIG
ncbi:hypothetical protein TEA_010528 [Camellia sinensis var. sinensis]|uniref:GDSL esterase/lipase APG n=2 Tax=Camellia sinensis TaxID=4442 RepID=A0A4S4EIA3_CAMSN|nr:hypothetical protein TEA_010528 [Camellia sinensis var. sinensis]